MGGGGCSMRARAQDGTLNTSKDVHGTVINDLTPRGSTTVLRHESSLGVRLDDHRSFRLR